MPDSNALIAFSIASFVLLASPGPAVGYIVTRGVASGARSGLTVSAGIAVADLVHVGAALLGFSALLAQSARAFETVRWLGIAYLVYLGATKLARAPHQHNADSVHYDISPRRAFREGFIINLLNPKATIFFLAFLPQFVNPAQGSPNVQIVVLGLLYAAIGIACDTLWATASGWAGRRLRSSPQLFARFDRGSGLMYLGLAAIAATGSRPTSTTS